MLEPHIYSLTKFIECGDDDYLQLFKMWKNRVAGGEEYEVELEEVKQYEVENSGEDCEGCKI